MFLRYNQVNLNMSEVKVKNGGIFAVLEIFYIGLSLRLELFGF